jgi:hypothetical protein
MRSAAVRTRTGTVERKEMNGMSKKLVALASVALAAILLGAAVLVVPGLAQEPEATPTAPPARCGPGFGFRGGSWEMFDAQAEALGLTPEELFVELHGGKSLTDIAEARGVDLEDVQDAMEAARAEAMKEAIRQAVEDGRFSQAQADWLLEGQELGFMPGGRGFGRGMRGPFGGHAPMGPPSAAPTTSS